MSITPVKPSQLREVLAKAIPRRRPILVYSSPGIGKSSIVEQSCAESGVECIVMHPVVSDPTDFKGMPWIQDGTASFVPFGDLQQLLTASQPTVCFLDDLGQANSSVQAAVMQLILARRISGHRVSDHVTFVAATNRKTDFAAVSGLLEPLKGRFTTCLELKADGKEWRAWADRSAIAPEVIAFLQFRPELLSDFRGSADITVSPSPRGWEHVSELLAFDLDARTQIPCIQGAIGEGAATEFVAFLQVWSQMVGPDLILTSPDTAPIPTEISALCAVSTALAVRVQKQSMPAYVRYLQRLCDEDRTEFAALSMKSCIARDANLSNTGAYVKAMSGPLGQILVGA
jgi:hypothetical protein